MNIVRKFRIYSDPVKRWYAEDDRGRKHVTQYEMPYKEYDFDSGELVATGTEDFSADRFSSNRLRCKWVWVWDGHTRNAGGHRWFVLKGTCYYKHKDASFVMRFLKRKYNAKEIDLR